MTKDEFEEIKNLGGHNGPIFFNKYYAPIGQHIEHADTINVRFDKDMNMEVDFVGKVTKAEEPQPAPAATAQCAAPSLPDAPSQTAATDQSAAPAQTAKSVLRDRINKVKPMIKSQRMWFGVAKGIMELEYVAYGDFTGAIALIHTLFPEGVPYPPATYALSRLDVQSFHRNIMEWNPLDAPVRGTTYQQYENIARTIIGQPRRQDMP